MRRSYAIGIAVLAVLCVLCMARLAQPSQVQQESQLDIQSEQSTEDDIIETIASAVEAAPQLTPKLAEEPAEEALESSEQPIEEEIEPYISPVDFDALWAINPDIYAWIYIPNTEISYPILQHDTDDDYYLSHDCYGNDSPLEGSIFTEKTYTSEEFTDPVTVVYGHRLKTGTMFSTLQSTYSTAEGMADCKEIIIYLPDREYHYTVVAAVPYDNRHILYNYDFSSNRMFRAFLNSIYSVREIGAVFDQDTVASPKDRLLILSTCLYGNAQKRYLVLAKCEEDINSPS